MKLSKGVLAVVAAMSAGCASGASHYSMANKPTTVSQPVQVVSAPQTESQPEPDPVPMTDPDPDWMAACGRG